MLHTNTRIYQRSLELARLSAEVIAALPRGQAALADQLRRAAASITLNFAEGCGKASAKDRKRYFLAARGSANEVVAIFDIALAFGVVDAERHNLGVDIADHLAAMLSRYR
jgi:four helix bundle protein